MKLSKLLKEKVSSFIMTIDKIPFVYDDVLFKEAIDLMNLNKLAIFTDVVIFNFSRLNVVQLF